MGYSEALEAAGAKVLAFREFGSYQGDWLALVEYGGERGMVEGSYGSCSGCDSFEAEFDDHGPEERDGKFYTYWGDELTAEEYKRAATNYNQRLADFGASYLTGGLYDCAHYEQKLAKLQSGDWFGDEQKELCEWAITQFKQYNIQS